MSIVCIRPLDGGLLFEIHGVEPHYINVKDVELGARIIRLNGIAENCGFSDDMDEKSYILLQNMVDRSS